MRLRTILLAAALSACDRAPVAPETPEEPTVSAVACAVDPVPDVDYAGLARPPIDIAWSGSARLSDGSAVVLDSAVVKLGGLVIRRYHDVNGAVTTLAAWETSDGFNNLIVTCHKGTRYFTANRPFEIHRR